MSDKMTVVSDGYEHEMVPLNDSQPAGAAAVVGYIAMYMMDVQKDLQEFLTSHELLKYYDDIYVDGILLGWNGAPAWFVQSVDDEIQYRTFVQQKKVEE